MRLVTRPMWLAARPMWLVTRPGPQCWLKELNSVDRTRHTVYNSKVSLPLDTGQLWLSNQNHGRKQQVTNETQRVTGLLWLDTRPLWLVTRLTWLVTRPLCLDKHVTVARHTWLDTSPLWLVTIVTSREKKRKTTKKEVTFYQEVF